MVGLHLLPLCLMLVTVPTTYDEAHRFKDVKALLAENDCGLHAHGVLTSNFTFFGGRRCGS